MINQRLVSLTSAKLPHIYALISHLKAYEGMLVLCAYLKVEPPARFDPIEPFATNLADHIFENY